MAFKRNCTGDHTGHNYDNNVIIILLSMAISLGLHCIINTLITSAHGVEYKGSTVDQSKYYSLH